MYEYKFTSRAYKELQKLERNVQFRIIEKLDQIVKSRNPLHYADHLTDYSLGGYRIRVGDCRVIFDMEDKTLIILKVGHRKHNYR
ncbi:MAG: type II toxin-antitoxin system RelE/ParE family toxin [Candidatus Woesebacteria bacterium]|jgi:mRNA interferase RelE/StbE